VNLSIHTASDVRSPGGNLTVKQLQGSPPLLGFEVLFANGAPRPMKMDTIASPWRYDAGARYALETVNLR
jgi:hypothetical protein